jgi:general secretion pathway protein G
MNKRRNRAAGFTLIELLLVVVIIGILAAIVVPKLAGRGEDAKKAAASGDIKSLSTALTMYEVDNQMYPTTDQGLAALLQKPGGAPEPKTWKGPYLQNQTEVPLDPWGNPYIYLRPGVKNTSGFDLFSAGPDAQPGTQDDVEK